MGYGDGAVMGVPATTSATSRSRRSTACRSCRSSHVDGEHLSTTTHWQDWYADKERGVTVNSDIFSGLRYEDAVDAVAARAGAQGPGREEDHLAPARLGHQPPALLGHADPDHPLRRRAAPCRCRRRTCRWCCRRTCVPDGSGNPLNKRDGVPARRRARSAASRRGARPTRWTPSSTRPGTSCATARRTTTRRWSTRAPTTGCRWTSTSAASSTRSCTCCTRASGPR